MGPAPPGGTGCACAVTANQPAAASTLVSRIVLVPNFIFSLGFGRAFLASLLIDSARRYLLGAPGGTAFFEFAILDMFVLAFVFAAP